MIFSKKTTRVVSIPKIWISKLDTKIKIQLFKCLIEPILLYGCETWTLSKKAEKRLDGTYTRLLMRVKNLSWKHHPTKHQIYGSLPPVSSIVRSKRVQFAGHCLRASSEIISPVVLLYNSHSIGRRSRKVNYIHRHNQERYWLARGRPETINVGPGMLEKSCEIFSLDYGRNMMMMITSLYQFYSRLDSLNIIRKVTRS